MSIYYDNHISLNIYVQHRFILPSRFILISLQSYVLISISDILINCMSNMNLQKSSYTVIIESILSFISNITLNLWRTVCNINIYMICLCPTQYSFFYPHLGGFVRNSSQRLGYVLHKRNMYVLKGYVRNWHEAVPLSRLEGFHLLAFGYNCKVHL